MKITYDTTIPLAIAVVVSGLLTSALAVDTARAQTLPPPPGGEEPEPNLDIAFSFNDETFANGGSYAVGGQTASSSYTWSGVVTEDGGVVYGEVYRSTLNDAELIASHEFGLTSPGAASDTIPETGDYFVAVYQYPDFECTGGDICIFPTHADMQDWFANGTASIPGAAAPENWGVVTFTVTKGYADCCSSVAFIPGIKATELYEGDDKKWLPFFFLNEATSLEMSSAGESLNPITVGAPIEIAYFTYEVYEDFFDFLNGLSGDTIAEWETLSYDWRFDVLDVANTDQELQNGDTLSLTQRVRSLAEDSDTGKVTLVAHSNGGLVGKALIDALGDDANEMVDRLIMVGTPQLGTPGSVAAMLHGENQALPLDIAPFAVNKATSRYLSKNMPGAYGLLPLQNYFDTVSDPVVKFATSTGLTELYRTSYGPSIDTSAELESFLLGIEDERGEPELGNIRSPITLNETLLDNAQTTRTELENWTPPSGIEVAQIAGWGLDTPRGVKYYDKCTKRPFSNEERCFLDIEPLMTTSGDGTVVGPSAAALAGIPRYYFDLYRFNYEQQTNWEHANMLAASSIQQFIRNRITGSTTTPEFITEAAPSENTMPTRLRVSVHSPITLGVRDSQGRFTGVQENPDPNSDIPVVVEEIPGSYYLEFGEGKYVGFDTDEQRELVMEGTGTGTFTLEMEEVAQDEVANTITFSNVPVSTTTTARLDIQDIANRGELELDTNGDGAIDETVKPDSEKEEELTPQELLEQYRVQVRESDMRRWFKFRLIGGSRVIERFIEKDRTFLTKLMLRINKKYIERKTGRGISQEDAEVLIGTLKGIHEKL